MEKEKIARINELAHLSKERPLTDAEKEEQKKLRDEYIMEIRASFGGILEHTVVEYPDGSRQSVKAHNQQQQKKK